MSCVPVRALVRAIAWHAAALGVAMALAPSASALASAPPSRARAHAAPPRAAAAPKPPASKAAPPADTAGNGCRQLPAHRRLVKLNLKPDTDVLDLVAWISSVTCKEFLVSGSISAGAKKVTIIAPELITAEEAYGLFLSALDSVGLTVQQSGAFGRIIETAKVKNSPISVYGLDGRLLFDAERDR